MNGLTSPMIVNSNILTGRPWPREGPVKNKNIKTSAAVSTTPAQRGSLGIKRQNPMAEPSNSARSVEMMAISDKT
jgi:hypothetical protein